MTTRVAFGENFIRQWRVNTYELMRPDEKTTQDIVSNVVISVCDCLIDEFGSRIYQTPQDVRDAIDNEELSWEDAKHITQKAARISFGHEKNA